jgi:hypothetical protein
VFNTVTDDCTPGLLAITTVCTKLQCFEVHGNYKPLFSDQLLAAIGALPQLQLLILKQGKPRNGQNSMDCSSEGMVSLVAAGANSKLRKLFLHNLGTAQSREQLKIACRACPELCSVNII